MTDSSHIDAHLIAVEADRIGGDGAHGGQGAHGARPYVEARAVARTLHLVAGERALAQRAAVVRAEVVDGKEVAADVGEGGAALAHLEDAHPAGGRVGRGGPPPAKPRPRPAGTSDLAATRS